MRHMHRVLELVTEKIDKNAANRRKNKHNNEYVVAINHRSFHSSDATGADAPFLHCCVWSQVNIYCRY